MTCHDLIAYVNYCLRIYYASLLYMQGYDYSATWSDSANVPMSIPRVVVKQAVMSGNTNSLKTRFITSDNANYRK